MKTQPQMQMVFPPQWRITEAQLAELLKHGWEKKDSNIHMMYGYDEIIYIRCKSSRIFHFNKWRMIWLVKSQIPWYARLRKYLGI